MWSERRRMEHERTAWDVERAQLKARISASERRAAQLETKWRGAQTHIATLELVLREAQGKAGGVDRDSQSTASDAQSAEHSVAPTVAEVVRATRDTRERSRELLRRCLEEVEALVAPCPAVGPSPVLPQVSPASARPAQAVQPTEQTPPHKLNGIIESDAADGASPGERLSLVSAQMPIRSEAMAGEQQASLSLPTKRPIKSVARRRRLSHPQQLAAGSGRPSSAGEKRAPGLYGELAWSQDMGDGVRRLAVDEVDTVRRSSVPAQWAVHQTFAGHLDCVRAVGVAGSSSGGGTGVRLVSGSDDGTVMVWDTDGSDRHSGRPWRQLQLAGDDVPPARILRGHLAAVTSVAVADGCGLAYSAGLDRTIKEWQLDGAADSVRLTFPVRELAGHTDAVWDLALAPARQLLASAAADGTCRLWSVAPGGGSPKQLASLVQASQGAAMAVPTSARFAGGDAAVLAIGYSTGAIEVRDVATEAVVAELPRGDSGGSYMQLGTPPVRVTRLACPSDGSNLVAAACTSGWVRVYDLRLSRAVVVPGIAAYRQAGVVPTALALPADRELATGGSNGTVRWWDLRKPVNNLCEIAAHAQKAGEGVCALVPGVGASARLLASAGADGLARLYQNHA
ncbi:1,2-dihydroxy-3-keto-5-methylthiopentene dioxygenase [Coemansia spiralis]|nr:1,2-dihydroxy-3-keto-5-methylthiopentene dioxygenase [Coemansia spiralis]